MKLEVGKRYRRRGGGWVKIVGQHVDGDFPFQDANGDIYRADGTWSTEDEPVEYDLILELKETPGEAVPLNCVQMDPSSVSANFQTASKSVGASAEAADASRASPEIFPPMTDSIGGKWVMAPDGRGWVRQESVTEFERKIDAVTQKRRDFFAMAALEGILAASNGWPDPTDMDRVAYLARCAGDALIAELDKKPEVKDAVE